MEALDKLDRQILRSLQADGRATYDEIADTVGLSPSAVLRRVKRLETVGVIDRYVALVKPEAVGLGLTAYINVQHPDSGVDRTIMITTPCQKTKGDNGHHSGHDKGHDKD